MDCGRRRRGNRKNNCPYISPSYLGPCQESPCRSKSGFLSGLCSFLILSALMALIYLMLEYHCTTCKNKCDMSCITKSIDDITKNLSHLKEGYYDLETQISKFSHEMPRLQGQIDILEAIANTLEKSEFGWNPKSHFSLPNVDVYLTKTQCNGKNVSRLVKTMAYTKCKDGVCSSNQCPASA